MSNNATKYTPLTTKINSLDNDEIVLRCSNCNVILPSEGYWFCKICTKEYCSLICFEMANFKLNHMKCLKHFYFPR